MASAAAGPEGGKERQLQSPGGATCYPFDKIGPGLLVYPGIVVGTAQAGEAVARGEGAAVCRHVISNHSRAGQGGIGLHRCLQQLAREPLPAELSVYQNAAQEHVQWLRRKRGYVFHLQEMVIECSRAQRGVDFRQHGEEVDKAGQPPVAFSRHGAVRVVQIPALRFLRRGDEFRIVELQFQRFHVVEVLRGQLRNDAEIHGGSDMDGEQECREAQPPQHQESAENASGAQEIPQRQQRQGFAYQRIQHEHVVSGFAADGNPRHQLPA